MKAAVKYKEKLIKYYHKIGAHDRAEAERHELRRMKVLRQKKGWSMTTR
jgi:hypothetical protein